MRAAPASPERPSGRGSARAPVETALQALGTGFLRHPDNGALRDALQSGALTARGYYELLVRLVYQLSFLLFAEERGLLHPAVLRGLSAGEPRLGLPALGGLFAPQGSVLDAALLERDVLLEVVRLLTVPGAERRPEELGRGYEGLLERVPVVDLDGRRFAFAAAAESRGNARKTSGSYYTPDSLVQVLLDSALEPVVARVLAARPADPAGALLALSIVDPACGVGHFLLAAGRRLAAHVARCSSGGAAAERRALQQVVGQCLYGVDLDPLAVELCRAALWLEAGEPGAPMTSLSARVRHGDALLGATPELLRAGIPDAAWAPIEGDDRRAASALRQRNRRERATPAADRAGGAPGEAGAGEAPERAQLVADAWCAAFVWPKPALGDPLVAAAPTQAVWRALRDGAGGMTGLTVQLVQELAARHRFFHWHLAFPEVFARGGFDVVLGNPPWERWKLQEQEFFAPRRPEIAAAHNAAARKRLIAALPATDPALWQAWQAAARRAAGAAGFVRASGRYPLCGRGDVNTYALFAEHNRALLRPGGRAGFIVPTGIATDDTTKAFFAALVQGGQLAALYSFQNMDGLFPAVHRSFNLALLTIDGAAACAQADLVFYARGVADLGHPERHFSLGADDLAVLNPNTGTCPTFRSRRDAEINLALYRHAGVLWREADAAGNPWGLRFLAMLHMANDSGLFHTGAALQRGGHERVGDRYAGPGGTFVPLVEAKMVHHFDHRFGSYEGQTQAGANQGKLPELDAAGHADPRRGTLPEYWVSAAEVAERLGGRWQRGWLLGWRDICRSTDQRTVIASLIPRAATGDTFLLALPAVEPRLVACLYANLCSFVLDYAARQKVGGTHLKYHTFKQLPVLAPSVYAEAAPWQPGASVLDFILPRVLELTYTAWDLAPFARDVGHEGPPYRWEAARRLWLRAELDAAYLHLYRLSRADAAHILDTFEVVRKNDQRAHGEPRTRRLILEVYDALSQAAEAGAAYQSRLAPGPADPGAQHPA